MIQPTIDATRQEYLKKVRSTIYITKMKRGVELVKCYNRSNRKGGMTKRDIREFVDYFSVPLSTGWTKKNTSNDDNRSN